MATSDTNSGVPRQSNQSGEEADIDEDLWPSPTKSKPKSQLVAGPQSGRKANRSERDNELSSYDMHGGSGGDGGGAREEALRRELQNVRRVNEAIEGAVESLAKAEHSMKTVNATVAAASSLLSTWTRILSQTEHNKRLILHPAWQGASQDTADAEQEAVVRQQAAERREYEEQERRTAAARKAEDDERRREDMAATRVSRGKTSSRGRVGRGLSRGGSTKLTSANATGSAGIRESTRRGSSVGRYTTSDIGRSAGSVRGRGRG